MGNRKRHDYMSPILSKDDPKLRFLEHFGAWLVQCEAFVIPGERIKDIINYQKHSFL